MWPVKVMKVPVKVTKAPVTFVIITKVTGSVFVKCSKPSRGGGRGSLKTEFPISYAPRGEGVLKTFHRYWFHFW